MTLKIKSKYLWGLKIKTNFGLINHIEFLFTYFLWGLITLLEQLIS